MMYEMAPSSAHEAASLEDYLAAVKDRLRLILILGLLGLVIGYLIGANGTDQFRASAKVVVNPTPVGSTIDGRLVAPNLDREVEIIVSDGVATDAVSILGTDEDPLPLRLEVETEFIPDSDVIRISFFADDKERVAEVVNAFAAAYVDQRVQAQRDFYDNRIAGLESNIEVAEEGITQAAEAIGSLDAEREELISDPNENVELNRSRLDSISVQRATLITQQNTGLADLRVLRTEVTALEAGRDSEVDAAVLLSEALEPRFAQGFSNTTLAIVGLLAGLLFGVIFAFVSSRLDRSADSEEEVAAALGTGVVGVVPDLGWRNRRGSAALAMLSEHKSVRIHRAREAYRRLRTSVEFLGRANDHRTFLITSSHPGEGKTVTASNLAVALATSGERVVLINADMRRPAVEKMFGIPNSENGLSAFLGGVVDKLELEAVEQAPNLFIVPAGPMPANPGELLASDRFASLIDEVSDQCDVVIVDTPPVAATADASAAAASVDAVIVVVDAKSTSLDELRVTRADLERAGANVVGAIINRDATRDAGLFARRNAYAYGRADGS